MTAPWLAETLAMCAAVDKHKCFEDCADGCYNVPSANDLAARLRVVMEVWPALEALRGRLNGLRHRQVPRLAAGISAHVPGRRFVRQVSGGAALALVEQVEWHEAEDAREFSIGSLTAARVHREAAARIRAALVKGES